MDMNLRTRTSVADRFETVLADRHRMLAYRDAIRHCVRAGDVVADLGCGPALLALFAAQAGARRVFAVERDPGAAALAQEIVTDNGYDGVITIIEADPATVDLGQQVDVVVTDMIGDFGPEREIGRVLGGFCERHLKPDGVAIPNRFSSWLAPVAFDGELAGLWWQDSYGFDLSAGTCHLGSRGARFVSPVRPWGELATPARIETWRFGPAGAERMGDGSASFQLADDGRLEGFLGWSVADLCRGISVTNRLRSLESSHPLWCWPVAPGVELAAGQRLTTRLSDMAQPTNPLAWRLNWDAE